MRLVKVICALLLIFIFNKFDLFAQDTDELPLLWKQLRSATHDTLRARLYQNIGENFEDSYPDSSIFYYNKSLSLSKKILLAGKYPDVVANKLLLLNARSLRLIGISYKNKGDYDQSISATKQAIEEFAKASNADDDSTRIRANYGSALCYVNIGRVNYYQGDFDASISNSEISLKIFRKLSTLSSVNDVLNAKTGMARCFSNIGMAKYDQGKYKDAVAYYLKALKIFETLTDKRGIAMCYNALANVYSDQKQYAKAIGLYQKTLLITREIGSKIGVARMLSNIGLAYSDLGLQSKDTLERKRCIGKALKYYQEALAIAEEVGDKKTTSACYNNLGTAYMHFGHKDLTLDYYMKSLNLAVEIGDKNAVASLNNDIANVHYTFADSVGLYKNKISRAHLVNAVNFGLKAIALAREINAMPIENAAASTLKSAYKAMGNVSEALRYAEIYITTRDTMFSAEKTTALSQMETQYKTEQQRLVIEKLNKDQELQLAKNQRQKLIIYVSLLGVILLILVGLFIANRLRITANQKHIIEAQRDDVEEKHALLNQQNEEILSQRDEIEAQRDEIESQRDLVIDQKTRIENILKEVNESISYAQLIQSAILPEDQLLQENFDSHFVIYKPKNIVSGDFYWWYKLENIIVVAVADCTGHGVPGGFMSMLGSSLLREIVQKEYITHPGVILRKLRKEVVKALKQKGVHEIQRDGLDIALISIDLNTRLLSYAGAQMPLIIARQPSNIMGDEAAITLIKGDKMPIGIHERMDPFVCHEIQLQPGDCLYMFTDGYVDQFGGPFKKKFSSKQLRGLLSNYYTMPLIQQQEVLTATIDSWRSENSNDSDQTDDITMVGLKII